jgi:hypothetical protein
MPCIRDPNRYSLPDGFICGNEPVYTYGGYRFEWHPYLGPTQLNKNGEPCKRYIIKFSEAVERWQALPKCERETYRAEMK